MVNPVVLIATHNRIEITTKNIKSLLSQSVKPKISITVSSPNEHSLFNEIDRDNIRVHSCENQPLGRKWQKGLEFLCRDADPLIITGSDDILGTGFIESACDLVEQGNHFIGLQRWWIHHNGKAYLCDYLPHQPLGGGRVYSKQMLERLNYKLFDDKANKHLDDYAWSQVRRSNLKVLWVRNVEKQNLLIHAIKGDWPTMNPVNMKHKNIQVLRSEDSKKVLPEFYDF